MTAKISAACTSSSGFRQSGGASLGRAGVGDLVLPRTGKRDRREAGSGFKSRINGMESGPAIRAFVANGQQSAQHVCLSDWKGARF